MWLEWVRIERCVECKVKGVSRGQALQHPVSMSNDLVFILQAVGSHWRVVSEMEMPEMLGMVQFAI